MMNRWLIALKFIGIGWFISFAILGGVLLGRWIDQQLNSEPVVLIIGLFFGLFVAFYGAYQLINGPSKNKN